ncbi:MAG TPA: MaoC/PaaZ C-terminal domain-containing protein [Roseiflexaceae bacterium]|nr:MaoC/PaaZ C-terminal domain-containing protein [Roseiflexaceae bacterium]
MSKTYYEDYTVGDEFVSPARTVTESDVVQFAGLTGDYNRLHTDAEYMRGSIFGERIAHGLLGLAIVNGLKYRTPIDSDGVIAFLGLHWTFSAPIRLGDTIHGVFRVTELRPTSKPDRGIMQLAVQVRNQRGEPVQEGQFTMMLKRRET